MEKHFPCGRTSGMDAFFGYGNNLSKEKTDDFFIGLFFVFPKAEGRTV